MCGFENLIGYDEVKTELKRFCDVLRNSEKYEKLGVTLPSGILFSGEPGIGKEMLLVDDIENKEFLRKLLEKMYDELPTPKKRK